MAQYCTNADVALEFKDITFGAGTAITSTRVDEFIVQADAEINAAISKRYTTPVTAGADALSILKQISILKVKCRLNSILSVKTPVEKVRQEPDGPSVCKRADTLLDAVVDGSLELPGAEASANNGGMESYLMNDDVDYKFQRDSDAW